MRYKSGQRVWAWVTFWMHDILFPLVVSAGFLCAVGYFSWPYLSQFMARNEQNLAERGGYYLTECQLLERNRYTGFWSGRENILQCGVTREHVNADAYEKAIRAWQQKQTETE
ncbi:hypothetical protein ISO70_00155 [Morganella morganii subsp. morganii]|uniref:hypothetical protein n=1 Tax=Morganella morganii TaxID=582 RepID=UPI001BDAD64D|nr:hypothetical protein [Morganella morganii]MBT0351077.1 hypothetical protein [Morganella morganii subsp. morganii]